MKGLGLITFTILSTFSIGQQSINGSGGDASGTGGSASFSVGELSYTTNTGTNGSSAQGVQHAYEVFSVGLDEPTINLNLSIYPNPTTDVLNIRLDAGSEDLVYQLCDDQGKIISKSALKSGDNLVDVSQLSRATYFLAVLKSDKIAETYKIVKQ